jgi:protein-S-isoprenylcysteine O-methyltransferase Ste14
MPPAIAEGTTSAPGVSRWRLARAIVLLPGTVAVLVPTLLVAADGPRLGWGLEGVVTPLLVVLGLALIGAGLALSVWTARLFARIGIGTPAPWDPPRRLVVQGPYRYVRNPMITGVMAVLLGEAVVLGRPSLLIWFAAFVAINHVYFILVEEPGLIRRYGDEYREYKSEVPRWIPRRKP